MRELVRIAQADLDGKKPVYHALRKILGVSYAFSHAVCQQVGIEKTKKVGELSEQQVAEVEKMIKNPELPVFLLNRRKERSSGLNKHVTGSDLRLQKEFDLRRLKKTKSYRGMRHAWGLPVRGQRTRGNFRRGGAVGVMKKKIAQAAAGGDKKKEDKK